MDNLLMVFASAQRVDDIAAFQKWYDDVHIPEVLGYYPEILSAVRYNVSLVGDHGAARPADSIAVYAAPDPAALWERLRRDRRLAAGPFLDVTSLRHAVIPVGHWPG